MVTKNLLDTSGTAQFIDVSEKPAQAKVVREGFQVPSVPLDTQKTDFFVNQLVPLLPLQIPRVISQSVAQGTKVVAGTVVDLVLAPRDSIPFDIFTDIHADLKGKPITAMDPVLNDAASRQILLANTNSTDLNAADKTTLTNAFQAAKIKIDETDPTRTFDLAFQTARGALAFR
jgi:hypothetical protein